MAERANLIKRRSQLKAAVTRFQTYVLGENVDLIQLGIRIGKIEDVWNEFEQVQSAIEMADDEDVEEQIKYRDDFENLYFKAMAYARKTLLSSEKGSIMSVQNDSEQKCDNITSNRISAVPVKLAALNVPVFNGNYREWSSFFDTFSAMIHTNKDLSSIQKFFYLRSALAEDALNCIKCLETTEKNYEVAWKILVNRYNNPKILVQTHVKAIFDLYPLNNDSAIKLRNFTDTLSGHMRALETLGQKPTEWGPLLVHLILTKLDKNNLSEWESSTSNEEIPSIDDLTRFLEKRFKILEAIETAKIINTRPTGAIVQNRNYQNNRSSSFVVSSGIKCYLCALPHTIYRCPTFISLAVVDRMKKVVELKLCRICLRKHPDKQCSSRPCVKCSRSHNILLHFPPRNATEKGVHNYTANEDNATEQNIESPSTTNSSISTHVSSYNVWKQVLLATAIVNVRNDRDIGDSQRCRMLLDSGSQCNLITENMVQNLRLKKKRIHHSVMGIGNIPQTITSSVTVSVRSLYNQFKLSIVCLVVPKITGLMPSKIIENKNCIVLEKINLADASFKVPQKIDLLLGASHFFQSLRSGQLKQTDSGPIFQNTEFGWVVSGSIDKEVSFTDRPISSVYYISEEENMSRLEDAVAKFWRLEEYESKTTLTLEEKSCKDHFFRTVMRDETGRFTVQFPFKENVLKLGCSYDIAMRRFLSLEKRFQNDPKLKLEYTKFMEEYESLNHMERINETKLESAGKMCYLPHHAVRNENSTTTKLRVVFDASCKTESGFSLNNILLKGPVIQDEFIYILSRFRTYRIAFTADIKKMYRQIWLSERHRDFQRILWRKNMTEPIQIFRLKTITYGCVPASFLATACLEKLSFDESDKYPEACESIRTNFYMDDYLGGAMNKDDAINLRTGLISTLKRAGLELDKWSANDPDLISDYKNHKSIDNEKTDNIKDLCANNKVTKILGLLWNANTDVFQFQVGEYTDDIALMKRKMLSDISTIFDPLGLLGPVIVPAKIMMQNLWHVKVGWDFVGANRHLKEVYELFRSEEHQNIVQRQLSQEGIEWRFVPPRSPHFGGLWESAVKSMKSLIYKVLGESHLYYEELCTILTRAETYLNSRSLTEMSTDPSDLTYLSPGHFLIGESLLATPERDENTMPVNRLDRWRRVRHFSQMLWKRWSQEYLNQLQERKK